MIAQFAVRLVCGMSLTWLLMPREKVTTGFFRIQALVTLGLTVLAALTLENQTAVAEDDAFLSLRAAVFLAVFIGVASYAASVFWMLSRRKAGDRFVYVIATCAAVLLLGTTPIRGGWGPGFSVLSELSAAWLLGGAVAAMLLGHWHLTATSMSLTPLARLTQLVGLAAVVRGAFALTGLLTLPDRDFSDVERIWLFLRWSAGCVGPIVLVLMVWRILRFRNTQSATGVLFAAVILAFIGETAAALLSRDLDWPV